ncbi:probable L-type lectin-domain containing receptor kinase S.5 [Euphorbia lathyris]|uniref:probable L-type lectin-domain containing receptor kinase S.5 n=1 Tax=Euphorbia lathyris TaxID=212925 RepID=UPI003313F301
MSISSAIQKLLILTGFLSISFPQGDCFYFNFSSFNESNRGQILLSSAASTIAFDAIQVTLDVMGLPINDLSGRTLYNKPFKLWGKAQKVASFNTTFVLNIQNMSNPGGEGLAFILTADPNVPPNSHGQWLGIVDPNLNGSSQSRTVAIEFDTRKSFPQDLDDDHVGLDVNSVYSLAQFSLADRGVNLNAGQNNTIRVQYDGERKRVNVFVKDMDDPVLSEDIDLSVYLPQEVFVGFSASTGNETQLNCVRSWEFSGMDVDYDDGGKQIWVWIVVPVLGVSLLVLVACFICLKRRRDMELLEDAYPSIEEAIRGSSTAPKKFKLKELNKATNYFSPKNMLGKGGFGTVYKGVMKGNKEIAVKKFSEKSTQGKTEFIAEVTTIGNLRHRNLVKLIGWCYESHEFLLVYEYMPNASLDRFIFINSESNEESTMGWKTRRNVVIGAAQALDYLHNGCEDTVLHRDIKSSNIMLDSEFIPKLGDFGLARTMKESDQTHHSTKEIAGTPGYMAPESILTGRFTVETDVYAFGVLILEVGCGRKPNKVDEYSYSIVNWVWDFHRKGSILDVADKRLCGEYDDLDMECFLVLGLGCCHPNPNDRPSMKMVLQVLKGEAPPPILPNQRPAFMWPPLPPSLAQLDISVAQIPPFSDIAGR